MSAENYDQSPTNEFHAADLQDEALASGVAPVGPAFPEELERIRAEKVYALVEALMLSPIAVSSAFVFTVVTRGTIAVSELVYETATNQPDAYELLNSVAALRISALVGVTAALGFGIHMFNKDMHNYRQQIKLEDAQERD